MRQFRLRLLLMAAGAWTLSGCTPSEILGKTFVMYPGARRPESELALVTCDSSSQAVILKVDDRPKSFVNCEKIGGLTFGATRAKVQLLPGRHTLRVRYWEVHYDFSGPRRSKRYVYSQEGRDLEVDVEAGVTYYLRATSLLKGWTATLERREEAKH
jgi:hypothetical protein